MRAAQNQLIKIEIAMSNFRMAEQLHRKQSSLTHPSHIYRTEESVDCTTIFFLLVSEVTESVCRVG